MKTFQAIWRYRSTLIFLITPIILLALPLAIPGKEALCGYCMILMGIYWMTEVLPLAITSFIPLILFPLLGIMSAADVSTTYFNNTNWLFVGGLTIAVAVETTNLHKRISLRVLTLVGAKPRCLMFGFMITTFFLSMWISNTATTAMMLPIVEAVTKELTQGGQSKDGDETIENGSIKDKTARNKESSVILKNVTSFYKNEAFNGGEDEINTASHSPLSTETELEETEDERNKGNQKLLNIQKGLTLCVPYAASIGGTVTVTGTGPNLILSGQFPILFPEATIQLSFANWFVYCLPSGLLFFFCAYIWISILFLGFNLREIASCFGRQRNSEQERNANELLKREYRNLGSIKWSEMTVLVVFVLTALLWFFREPGFMPGWSELFEEGYVEDGTIAVAMASTLFFLPVTKPMFLNRGNSNIPSSPVAPILKWSDMQKLFPWNIVILLGGGFALAEGATTSGLSQWLGDALSVLEGLQPWLICLIITIVLCVFTEFTSNVATASIFVPILATLAQTIGVHPIYLLLPPVLATSMAFMLPVATPPNAIAFAYGHLKVIDMMKTGCLLNVIGVAIVTLFINTYGVAYFGLNEFPDWANPSNATN